MSLSRRLKKQHLFITIWKLRSMLQHNFNTGQFETKKFTRNFVHLKSELFVCFSFVSSCLFTCLFNFYIGAVPCSDPGLPTDLPASHPSLSAERSVPGRGRYQTHVHMSSSGGSILRSWRLQGECEGRIQSAGQFAVVFTRLLF